MTARLGIYGAGFKWAMTFSVTAHALILLVIILNPSLPKPQRKGMMIYLPTNMIGLPGGGGGGGGVTAVQPKSEENLGTTEVKRDTLRDLSTLSKLQAEPKSELRYPTDKPKKEPAKKAQDKKAVITKSEPSAKPAEGGAQNPAAGAAAGGRGSGLTIGAGGPGFGEGVGGDFAGQIGLSNFPYTYYLTWIRDKISADWFTSLVDPGVSGTYHVAVYFRIYRNGSISSVDIKESSGIESLNLSAIRAVTSSAPFPPLPADFREDYLGIILIFEHSK